MPNSEYHMSIMQHLWDPEFMCNKALLYMVPRCQHMQSHCNCSDVLQLLCIHRLSSEIGMQCSTILQVVWGARSLPNPERHVSILQHLWDAEFMRNKAILYMVPRCQHMQSHCYGSNVLQLLGIHRLSSETGMQRCALLQVVRRARGLSNPKCGMPIV